MAAPPFRLTPALVRACASLERSIGRCEGPAGTAPTPRLRRENRIRTVQATTAIEGNTLTLPQVTAVLDGKRVAGSAREIREVQNALDAYALVGSVDPRTERGLLRAHRAFLQGLAPDAGRYRRSDVGIVTRSRVKHVAPPAARVPSLMRDLLRWARERDETPPLVKASVLHYELEFIHPFTDGNGRAGRWWQHALLVEHAPILAHVPVELTVRRHQAAYYDVLGRCDRAGDATDFVLFMLDALGTALSELAGALVPRPLTASERIARAREHFGKKAFTRAAYRALHPGLSTATASRDLAGAVANGALRREGDKATARYAFRSAARR